jgi:uracil-DNA glycosylase
VSDLFPPQGALSTSVASQFDQVPPGWRPLTEAFRASPAGQALIDRLEARRLAGATIYPADLFAALQATPPEGVRVVILGQDPYHGPDQAHGLAFSVPQGQKIPPSLRNIHKVPASGNLMHWARQGVLLLNTGLSVEDGAPASHAGWGWEVLTDAIVAHLASQGEGIVFMLWGAHAQRKHALIDAAPGRGHLILMANHPSPLSALRPPVPFIGCDHFAQAARHWAERGVTLNW